MAPKKVDIFVAAFLTPKKDERTGRRALVGYYLDTIYEEGRVYLCSRVTGNGHLELYGDRRRMWLAEGYTTANEIAIDQIRGEKFARCHVPEGPKSQAYYDQQLVDPNAGLGFVLYSALALSAAGRAPEYKGVFSSSRPGAREPPADDFWEKAIKKRPRGRQFADTRRVEVQDCIKDECWRGNDPQFPSLTQTGDPIIDGEVCGDYFTHHDGAGHVTEELVQTLRATEVVQFGHCLELGGVDDEAGVLYRLSDYAPALNPPPWAEVARAAVGTESRRLLGMARRIEDGARADVPLGLIKSEEVDQLILSFVTRPDVYRYIARDPYIRQLMDGEKLANVRRRVAARQAPIELQGLRGAQDTPEPIPPPPYSVQARKVLEQLEQRDY